MLGAYEADVVSWGSLTLTKPAQVWKVCIKQEQAELPSYQAFLVGSAIHVELDNVIIPLYLHPG